MERACVQAKSANVAFSGKFQGAIDGELKGSLLLATGNKFRLEMKGDLAIGTDGIQPVNVAMVCDGKQSRTASLDPKILSQVVDVTNNYDTEMRLQLARAGILDPMFLLAENVPPGQKPREFDAEKQLGVSDFQLGENQIIGEQQALTIHHKLHNRNYTEPLTVTVWLDGRHAVHGLGDCCLIALQSIRTWAGLRRATNHCDVRESRGLERCLRIGSSERRQ